MEWEPDSPCHSPIYPGQGRRSPTRCRGWEVEFRDCGAISGWGLLLTVERGRERMWGRRLWREMPVEKCPIAMEARRYCWVTCRGWSHHYSLSLPTHQHQQLNNREADPSNAWCTELQSRTPTGGPSMCLTWGTTEKDLRQGSHLSAWNVELWRKTGQIGLLMDSYKRLDKRLWWRLKSCGEGTPCPCTLGQGLCKPSSCTTLTLNSH